MSKTASKIFVGILFIYCAVFSFVLTVGAFSHGLSVGNLITFLLFLPVTGYFLTELRWQSWHLTGGFRLSRFLAQRDPYYIGTAFLFLTYALLVVLKARGIV